MIAILGRWVLMIVVSCLAIGWVLTGVGMAVYTWVLHPVPIEKVKEKKE